MLKAWRSGPGSLLYVSPALLDITGCDAVLLFSIRLYQILIGANNFETSTIHKTGFVQINLYSALIYYYIQILLIPHAI